MLALELLGAGMPTSAAELMPCVRDVLARHPLCVVVPNVQEGMQFVETKSSLLRELDSETQGTQTNRTFPRLTLAPTRTLDTRFHTSPS